MRTNAIVRIVIWSIVIVLLVSILGAGLLYRHYARHIRESTPEATYIPEPIASGNDASSSFDPAAVREIEIEWAAGTITICPDDDTDVIRVTEDNLQNEKYAMSCFLKDGELSIRFSKDDFRLSIGDDMQKNLTIQVPAGWACGSLEIDAASADLKVNSLTLENVDFDGASGVCAFENCVVGSMDVDTASGDIHFSGSLKTLDLDAASASFYGNLVTPPRRIDVDSMSGNLELTLPADAGFTARVEGLSSRFSSDFETVIQNGSYIHGDGSCSITVDAMSGDVTINKAT